MAVQIKNLKAAKRYSKALLELSGEFDLNKILESLSFAVQNLGANEELETFLNNPVISKADKKDVLEQIFKDKIETPVLNLLFLLIENGKIDILGAVYAALQDEINEQNNVVKAEITSVIELNEEQKKEIIEKLQNKINKTILPEYSLNSDILGGLVIKINDTVIDLSLKHKLAKLKI